MQEEKKLAQFEKEYFIEASELNVSVDDLKAYGVTSQILSGEQYMISRFGNEIVEHTVDDEIDENARAEITSLDDYDLESSLIFTEIIKRIDSSEFDDNLETAIGGLEI